MANVYVYGCLRQSDGKIVFVDANCSDVQLPLCVKTNGELWVYHADCDGYAGSDGWYLVCVSTSGLRITIPDDCCMCGDYADSYDIEWLGETDTVTRSADPYAHEFGSCYWVGEYHGCPGGFDARSQLNIDPDTGFWLAGIATVTGSFYFSGLTAVPVEVAFDPDGANGANASGAKWNEFCDWVQDLGPAVLTVTPTA